MALAAGMTMFSMGTTAATSVMGNLNTIRTAEITQGLDAVKQINNG
jgi:hypothetical protein